MPTIHKQPLEVAAEVIEVISIILQKEQKHDVPLDQESTKITVRTMRLLEQGER